MLLKPLLIHYAVAAAAGTLATALAVKDRIAKAVASSSPRTSMRVGPWF